MRAWSMVFGMLPASRAKNRLLRLAGHEIHPTASISPVAILGGARILAGPGSSIGALTAIRNVTVSLGECSEIGQLNWISAAPFLVDESPSALAGRLTMGEHASLTNRHYVDASGGVSVGPFATVAGVRSVFMTHGIDVGGNALETKPVQVGAFALVGSTCKLVMGATVPERSVVGMGSVVLRGLTEADSLYAGAPAVRKRAVEGAYFRRTTGRVPARPRGGTLSSSR